MRRRITDEPRPLCGKQTRAERPLRFGDRWKSVLAVLLVPLTALASTRCTGAHMDSSRTGSANVAADVGEELRVKGPLVARVHAKGFQIYTCQPDAAGKLGWKLKAPDATFEGQGGLKGRHYSGPTWESTTDGSKVVARKVAEQPAPGGDAVPWLLLQATGHEGNGVLSGVTFIQRVNTTGGNAPSTEGAKAGDEVRIPYTADYVFYGPGATRPDAQKRGMGQNLGPYENPPPRIELASDKGQPGNLI